MRNKVVAAAIEKLRKVHGQLIPIPAIRAELADCDQCVIECVLIDADHDLEIELKIANNARKFGPGGIWRGERYYGFVLAV